MYQRFYYRRSPIFKLSRRYEGSVLRQCPKVPLPTVKPYTFVQLLVFHAAAKLLKPEAAHAQDERRPYSSISTHRFSC
jgi:hypothetical protein